MGLLSTCTVPLLSVHFLLYRKTMTREYEQLSPTNCRVTLLQHNCSVNVASKMFEHKVLAICWPFQ